MKLETIVGTITGTAFSAYAADALTAVIMATIGATTSFFVTMGLKHLIKRNSKNRSNHEQN